MENIFYNAGVKIGTDKITYHGYHRFYDRFISIIKGSTLWERYHESSNFT